MLDNDQTIIMIGLITKEKEMSVGVNNRLSTLL